MALLSSTLELFGTLSIAFAALKVHHRVLNEHSIDQKVIKEMRLEQIAGIFGVILLITGYITGLAV
jgi:hypothetical protein